MNTILIGLIRKAHRKHVWVDVPKENLPTVNVSPPSHVSAVTRSNMSIQMKGLFTLLLCSLSFFAQAQFVCSFNASNPTGTNTVSVQRVDSVALPAIYGTSWDFGDGATAFGAFATHTYNQPGNYLICCTLFNLNDSTQQCNQCQFVQVGNTSCSFGFTTLAISPDSATVSFSSNSNYDPSQYNLVWGFGDGQVGVGQSVIHHYDSIANYSVTFSVYSLQNPDSLVCQTATLVNLNAGLDQPVDCHFFSSIPTGNGPYQVVLSPVNPNAAYYSWVTSDGQSSNLQSPTFTFASPGVYYITLHASSSSLSFQCNFTDTLVISGTAVSQCSFQTFPGNIPGAFAFVNNTPDSTYHYVFAYGDMTVDTVQYANGVIYTEHYFPISGTQSVCLQAFDAQWNLVCNWCTTVTVDSIVPSMCEITFLRDTLNPLLYQFTAPSVPSGATITWEFPGLGSFSGPTQQIVFPQAWQTYYACVTVHYNGMSCSNCLTIQPTIYPCNPNFMVSTAPNTAFFFSNGITGPQATLNWDFGDGTTSTEQFPYHVYANPGVYNVCLTITDAYCQATYCDTVQIFDLTSFPPPNGDTCSAFFVPLPSAGNLMNIVSMVNGSNLQFAWTLNNTLVSTEAFPQFSITSMGNYQLCLTIYNGNGCTASYCDSMDVDSADVASGSMMMRIVSPQMLTAYPASVQQREETRVTAWPNPVSDLLNLTGTQAGTAYRVMSVDGRLIAKGLTKEKQTLLDTGGWLPGLYVVQLQNPDGTLQNIKVVRQ